MVDIELVIKIPEEIRQAIIANIPLSFEQKSTLDRYVNHAIASGTLLPKGHGRLIDASYLLNLLKCDEYESCAWKNCSDCNQEKCIRKHNILESPTIVEADKEQTDG